MTFLFFGIRVVQGNMINPKGAHVLARIRWAGGPDGWGAHYKFRIFLLDSLFVKEVQL
jgi:hypothetical protein